MTLPSPAAGAPRRVLMIAYHFPPLAGSSGIQRTLRFVQHLPTQGWQPLVLSAHPRAYDATSDDLLAQVPADTVVERPFALDTARHLALAGRYPGFLARPDRWATWALGAVPRGLQMIRRWRPDVIWSTYPIASAHRIALQLHRMTGVPLVADFRDPMAQDGYPADPRTWRAFQRIEQSACEQAAKVVFVTSNAREVYRARYPWVPAERFEVIENGYDEESFTAAEREHDSAPLNPGRFTLLHSGIVYPSERDPRALFEALGRLLRAGRISAERLCLRFRAPVHVDLLRDLAARTQTGALVEILPAMPYREALKEMLRADGLMVMQGANCNEQIPAKLYEYFRARRPLLGLADPRGDTGQVMQAAGVQHIATLEDTNDVESTLMRYLDQAGPGLASPLSSERLAAMSREARTKALADLLDAASRGPGP